MRSKGDHYEELACQYLSQKGYEIYARNYYASKYGEIDIIALDHNKKVIVFIEVKARTGRYAKDALNISLSPSKINKLNLAIEYWLGENENIYQDYLTRIDALLISEFNQKIEFEQFSI